MNNILPIINGAIHIDNSNIEQLQYCPRSWLFKYGLKRIKVVPAAGRNFGSALHEGWACRYTQYGEHRVTDDSKQVEAITKYLHENPQPEDDFRNLDHALVVARAYNRHYQDESFKILTANNEPIVERSFALDIGTVQNIPVKYTGKIDLGVRDQSGLWVIDHKTAFQFGQQFEMEMAMDTGQLGYTWAFRELFKEMPTGFITNAVRIRRPKKGDEYNEIAPCDGTDMKRLITCVTPDQLEEFRKTVLTWVSTLLWYHDQDYFPRVSGKRGCIGKYGPCDFYDVCNAPIAAREGLLASSLFEDNNWSPLKKKGSE